MAKLIKSILANRMMFRGGGLVPPSQAAGILASSSPLIDSVTLNEGGPVNFANGGMYLGASPAALGPKNLAFSINTLGSSSDLDALRQQEAANQQLVAQTSTSGVSQEDPDWLKAFQGFVRDSQKAADDRRAAAGDFFKGTTEAISGGLKALIESGSEEAAAARRAQAGDWIKSLLQRGVSIADIKDAVKNKFQIADDAVDSFVNEVISTVADPFKQTTSEKMEEEDVTLTTTPDFISGAQRTETELFGDLAAEEEAKRREWLDPSTSFMDLAAEEEAKRLAVESRLTEPGAETREVPVPVAKPTLIPTIEQAEEVVEAQTDGGPDYKSILADAPFTTGDAELKLLNSILGQGMLPAGDVDEKSLREEIDALLPAIKEDPTGKALQYFLLAAQVADKGIAEGFKDGLPTMIKYRGERQKEIRQREQDVAALVLKEKLDVRSEKRALNAARKEKLWEYQSDEMLAGLKVSPYMVLKDTVVPLKALGYTDEEIEKLGVDKLTLRAGDTPPGLSRNKADALKDLGVSLAPVEDVDIDLSDILKNNAPANYEISEGFNRAVGILQKILPSKPYLLFGDKLDNNAFSVDVVSPDVVLANDRQILKQLLDAGFEDSVQKMLSGDSIVSPTALRGAQQEYTKRFTALNSLQEELVALDKLTGAKGLTGAHAAIEQVGEWAQGLGFAWSKELGDYLLADAFKETGQNVSIDTQYSIKSHMFLSRAAKLLLGEEGKTISNQDRTRIAQAIGLDLELSKDGDVISVDTTGFKRLLKNPYAVKFALRETGNVLSTLTTGLNSTYRNFLTDIAGVETKSQELHKSTFVERGIKDPAKRAAFVSSLSPEGQSYNLENAFSLNQAIDIGELMLKEKPRTRG